MLLFNIVITPILMLCAANCNKIICQSQIMHSIFYMLQTCTYTTESTLINSYRFESL